VIPPTQARVDPASATASRAPAAPSRAPLPVPARASSTTPEKPRPRAEPPRPASPAPAAWKELSNHHLDPGLDGPKLAGVSSLADDEAGGGPRLGTGLTSSLVDWGAPATEAGEEQAPVSPYSTTDWAQAIVLREILGPPRAFRDVLEDGPLS